MPMPYPLFLGPKPTVMKEMSALKKLVIFLLALMACDLALIAYAVTSIPK
jgi:hypothetical protein